MEELTEKPSTLLLPLNKDGIPYSLTLFMFIYIQILPCLPDLTENNNLYY